MQTVEHSEDALAERRPADNAVVDDDEVVLMGRQTAVADVVDVGSQVVTLCALGDEGAQLDVLPHHLLGPDLLMAEPSDAFSHAVESHLGRVGDIREDRVGHVAVDGPQDGLGQLLTQTLALLIDVAVGTAAEVDTLERTAALSLLPENLLHDDVAVASDDEGLAGLQFADGVGLQSEAGLNDGPLAGHDDHLVVVVVESGSDAPWVAHGKHFAAARQTTHHVASVEAVHRRAQHVAHLDVVVDMLSYVGSLKSRRLGFLIEPLHLAVKTVAHQFEHQVGVAEDAWRLTLTGEHREHLVDVGHVEVATEAEVSRPPVVAPEEGVDELQSALACRRVAQVAHQ